MKKKNKIKRLFNNKRVFFDYEILEKIEAGMILAGTEVKSIRNGKISMNGSFCIILENEIFVRGIDIALYEEGSFTNHESKRDRKLLLHKKQIDRLKVQLEEKGLTIVPIKMYENDKGIFKMEIGIARGRKTADKRNYIKDRESRKELKEITG
jgi:SsrA-binding protein